MFCLATWHRAARFKKCKQLFEYQHLHLLRDIGGESSNLYLNVLIFPTFIHNVTLIRHLWQLQTVVLPALVSNTCCSIE
jgi:hypothetical protein